MSIDELDVRLITLFAEEPHIGVLEASRRLSVARGTVQARLDRLQRSGVVMDFAPTIDPAALGFPVMAFITAEITQGDRSEEMIGQLRQIPELLEAYTVTGQADLLIRVVAKSNSDLQRVIDRLVAVRGIARTATLIVLDMQVTHRTLPLVQSVLVTRDERVIAT